MNSRQRKLKILRNSGMRKWQFYKSKDTAKKKLINVKKESNKLKHLTYLKSQVPPEPSSKADEVCSYIRLPLEENEKNKRLYVEVRYARVS